MRIKKLLPKKFPRNKWHKLSAKLNWKGTRPAHRQTGGHLRKQLILQLLSLCETAKQSQWQWYLFIQNNKKHIHNLNVKLHLSVDYCLTSWLCKSWHEFNLWQLLWQQFKNLCRNINSALAATAAAAAAVCTLSGSGSGNSNISHNPSQLPPELTLQLLLNFKD